MNFISRENCLSRSISRLLIAVYPSSVDSILFRQLYLPRIVTNFNEHFTYRTYRAPKMQKHSVLRNIQHTALSRYVYIASSDQIENLCCSGGFSQLPRATVCLKLAQNLIGLPSAATSPSQLIALSIRRANGPECPRARARAEFDFESRPRLSLSLFPLSSFSSVRSRGFFLHCACARLPYIYKRD